MKIEIEIPNDIYKFLLLHMTEGEVSRAILKGGIEYADDLVSKMEGHL